MIIGRCSRNRCKNPTTATMLMMVTTNIYSPIGRERERRLSSRGWFDCLVASTKDGLFTTVSQGDQEKKTVCCCEETRLSVRRHRLRRRRRVITHDVEVTPQACPLTRPMVNVSSSSWLFPFASELTRSQAGRHRAGLLLSCTSMCVCVFFFSFSFSLLVAYAHHNINTHTRHSVVEIVEHTSGDAKGERILTRPDKFNDRHYVISPPSNHHHHGYITGFSHHRAR